MQDSKNHPRTTEYLTSARRHDRCRVSNHRGDNSRGGSRSPIHARKRSASTGGRNSRAIENSVKLTHKRAKTNGVTLSLRHGRSVSGGSGCGAAKPP